MAHLLRSDVMSGVVLGAVTWLAGSALVRAFGSAFIPEVSDQAVLAAVVAALVATAVVVALCWRLASPGPYAALLFGSAFASVHLVLDAGFLFSAFRRHSWAPGLSLGQVEGIAPTLPLGYLMMLWVPVACEAQRRRAVGSGETL
jgi:hypothetical protein